MNEVNCTEPYQQTTRETRISPFGEDFTKQMELQKKQQELERKAKELDAKEAVSMRNKLGRIAELFEMDVLSEDDALKACKTVIQQHAKKHVTPEKD
jgi:hypothetical protein